MGEGIMKTKGSDYKSVRLTCESADYYLDKEHRDRLNAESAHERTLHLLPQPTRQPKHRRWLKIALFGLLTALLFTPLSLVQAQGGGQADVDGGEDGYHPALVEYRLGLFYLVREEWDVAIQLLPEHAAAFEARGYCNDLSGNIEQATADYQQAITLEPEYGPTYKLLANLYYTQGNHPLALENYRMYVSMTGDEPDVVAVERVAELEAALS
jgi:tetratricopeptide (TPR) repeat protein